MPFPYREFGAQTSLLCTRSFALKLSYSDRSITRALAILDII